MKTLLAVVCLLASGAAHAEMFVCYARGIDAAGFLSRPVSGLGTSRDAAREHALQNCQDAYLGTCRIITCDRAAN